jgi:hypothetical protein
MVIRRLTRMRAWIVIAAAGLVLAASAAVLIARDEPQETFCTMEGMIAPGGEVLGRSTSRDCQFVDGDGDLLTTVPNGEPLCYGEVMRIVSCDEPGARRPG